MRKSTSVLSATILTALAASIGISTSASAQSTGATGPIGRIDMQTAGGGKVIFYQGGNRSGVPACASNLNNRWAFDGTTPSGQATLSILLSAYMSGKSIQVVGMGTCSAWGDTETVNYIVMQ